MSAMHIHAQTGDMECKFWILEDELDVRLEFAYNLSPKDLREIRKIIFAHFDQIVDSWKTYFGKK